MAGGKFLTLMTRLAASVAPEAHLAEEDQMPLLSQMLPDPPRTQGRYLAVNQALGSPLTTSALLVADSGESFDFRLELSDLPWALPGTIEVVDFLCPDERSKVRLRVLLKGGRPGSLPPVFVLSAFRTQPTVPKEKIEALAAAPTAAPAAEGGAFLVGTKVEFQMKVNGAWKSYEGVIAADNGDGNYKIDYDPEEELCAMLFELNRLNDEGNGGVGLDHVVFVNREDVQYYKSIWPKLVLAVLPVSGRAHTYSRAIIKRVTRKAGGVGEPVFKAKVGGVLKSFSVDIDTIFLLEDKISFQRGYKSEPDSPKVGVVEALQELAATARRFDCALAGLEKASLASQDKISPETEYKDDALFYKCFYIDARKTNDLDFFAGLRCAEDIDFVNRAHHAKLRSIKFYWLPKMVCSVCLLYTSPSPRDS